MGNNHGNRIMKKTTILTMLTLAFALTFSGCGKTDENNTPDQNDDITVTVTTHDPTDITSTSAVCGGEVLVSENAARVEAGLCWATTDTPTVNDHTIVAETNETSFSMTIDGLEPMTEYWVRAYAKVSDAYYYGESKAFTTGEDLWVDLGLPNGTLWAKYNLGASAPEEYGDYYAWGETEPKALDEYDWGHYRYGTGIWDITKYCTDAHFGHEGFKDGLSTLLPEDDAATVNWGPECHIPTDSEWGELILNTTNIWTEINGIYGRLFTGTNGNSIFLPFAGGYNGNDVPHVNETARYWSSTLNSTQSNHACFFHAIKASCGMLENGSRVAGHSIRPVR